MKQLFQIINDETEAVQPVLYLRLGETHCSFAIADNASQKIKQVFFYSRSETDNDPVSALTALHPQLNRSFYRVQVSYDYPQYSFLSSGGLRHDEAGNIRSILPVGEKASVTITEQLTEWQLFNIYAIPRELHEQLTRKFPAANFCHQASAALKNSHAAPGGYLQVDFRPNEFSLLAIKNNKLLLSRSFEYSAPEDVIYYLLKTCQQFSLSQNEVQLELSGLIDQQSALYKELYQYFIHVDLRQPAWNIGDKDHPAHFFTSLNDLVKCES